MQTEVKHQCCECVPRLVQILKDLQWDLAQLAARVAVLMEKPKSPREFVDLLHEKFSD